ncbi:MAG: hypothetical protein A2X59_12330 [Nitrospirae bacterium GWC2_42_7]|nr:MAG: hypothetical protein A2X59_12330 [Nitrospirae bacterium GWC2_42_7]
MSIDVLLIKPDFNDIAVMPHLGLGYLASALAAKGMSVQIHDNTLLEYDDHRMVGLIKEVAPRVVGIYAATPMIKRALEIAGLARKVSTDILTVMGGPHPSCTVEETLHCKDLDVVVIGEGEESFPQVVASHIGGSKDFSDIEGCAFKNDKHEIVLSPPREMIKDLDSLPFPALDMMPIELYFKKRSNFGVLQKNSRSLPIIASRGCPSNCTFCQRFLGKKFRVRSAENIVDELVYMKNKFNVTEFNFLDDNFTLHKRRVLEVCDLIHKKGLKITFRFPNGVREDFLDEDILRALKSVGCYHLDFGIESGSQKVLDLMKKGKKIEKIAEKVHLCKKNGFKLSASFLFGTPGETLGDMEESIRFAVSLPLDSASFGTVIPFPGTELRKEVIEKGYLVHSEYEYYNPGLDNFKPPIETQEWTADDLLDMLKKANQAFFFRPKQVLKMLPTIMLNPSNIRRYMVSLFRTIKG